MIILLVILILIGVPVLLIAGMYNSLIRVRNRVENAWAQIDVQLKRRTDLIPNLVETVKGYAKHEKETLTRVTDARAQLARGGTPGEMAQANNMLEGALKSLFAVAENYPDLKANQNFLMLQEELSGTENKIAYARQFYNDSVMIYNTRIETFPNNLLANAFNFTEKEYFEVPEVDKGPVEVKF